MSRRKLSILAVGILYTRYIPLKVPLLPVVKHNKIIKIYRYKNRDEIGVNGNFMRG
jgi:hypothetical protein